MLNCDCLKYSLITTNSLKVRHSHTNKDISFGKVPYPTLRESWCILHIEVQVKPMSKFDLEANSDGIVPLFTGDVEDEATIRKRHKH